MIKRIMKSKMLIGTVVIVLALAVGFVGVPAYNRMLSGTMPVVRAKTEIRQGTKITPDMIETVQMGRKNLQTNTTGDESKVVGTYAVTEIQPNDIITGTKLSRQPKTETLADGQMLMSITMKNLSDSISGQIQSGDIVTVFVPQQQSTQQSSNAVSQSNTQQSVQTSAASSPPELQYVKVASITAANGQSAGSTVSQGSSLTGSNSTDNTVPATVTVIVNQKQAAVLAAVNQKEVQLALACHGDSAKGDQLLQKQKDLLSSEGTK